MKYKIFMDTCHGRSSRAPQGARGLKCRRLAQRNGSPGRAPQGARGLKFYVFLMPSAILLVAPRKGRVG